MSGGNPTIQGDLSDVEDFLDRHEMRTIVMKPWNIYTRIGRARAARFWASAWSRPMAIATPRSWPVSRTTQLALAGAVFMTAACLACGTAPTVMEPFEMPQSTEAGHPEGPAQDPEAGDYLHQVAVRDAFSDTYLLHWPKRKMPLAVYLPAPPEGLFPDPEATRAEVRRGVLDWTDVAAPGVPSFRFVESHGEADIPIIWAEEPTGDWYIAYCSLQANLRQKRLDVEQILVTGRWGDGRVAQPSEIYETVLHEMGHALGLLGHSDDPGDIMFPGISRVPGKGLSARDRNTLRELYAGPNRQIRGRRGRRY